MFGIWGEYARTYLLLLTAATTVVFHGRYGVDPQS
jgi:hypothetical protein